MVTSIPSMTSPHPTYSAEHEVFVENSRVSIEQPLICVDGYILTCRFDGERCTPTFAIGIADLLKAVRTELETLKGGVHTQNNNALPLQSPSSSVTKARLSPTMPHPLNYSRKRLFRQNSRESPFGNTKRLSDDLTGVSYDHIENTYRNSFILPTPEKAAIGATDPFIDLNDNCVDGEEVDTKKHLELEPQIHWVKENCSDYVNTETVQNCAQLNTLLNILLKMPSATLVTMKIVESSEINVTYQFMDKFKQDYMVVKIRPGYAMLMKTF